MPYSSHLSKYCRRLNLVCILLEQWRELRRKLLNDIFISLSLAETDSIFFAIELQLHHIIGITETQIASKLVSPFSVSS